MRPDASREADEIERSGEVGTRLARDPAPAPRSDLNRERHVRRLAFAQFTLLLWLTNACLSRQVQGAVTAVPPVNCSAVNVSGPETDRLAPTRLKPMPETATSQRAWRLDRMGTSLGDMESDDRVGEAEPVDQAPVVAVSAVAGDRKASKQRLEGAREPRLEALAQRSLRTLAR